MIDSVFSFRGHYKKSLDSDLYFFRFAFFIKFVSRVLPALSVKKESCYAFYHAIKKTMIEKENGVFMVN